MSTARDRNVLNMILNPYLPTSAFDGTESLEDAAEITTDSTASLPNFDECKRLELEGVKLAEEKQYAEAQQKFSAAIEKCPANPSPYNNRAQMHRLQSHTDEAMADLNEAIALCNKDDRKGEKRITGVTAQAHVQRALVHQLRGDDDAAKVDYEIAAAHGSTFAKTQLVALNPYAAMCNKMLREVMEKIQ